MALHTILGANGTIATELLPVLLANKEQVRLVSRSAKPVEGTETVAADVLNAQQVRDAIKGSAVVYLLVGLQYDIKVWRASWPVIMHNVIDACKAENAKLIFFDNVYMYGKVNGKMTEESPYHPVSKKGEVRAAIANMLLAEMKAGALQAAIARAADFYGPRCTDKSATGILFFERLKKKQKAQTFSNAQLPHSYTYTPDAGRALYTLAKSDLTWGQVWHLPTAAPALTSQQFVDVAAKYMQGGNKVQVLPTWMIGVIGWFSPMMREMHEMLYQNEYAYVFDSSKFERTFNELPTSYEQGIKETAEWFLSR
ncbi:MAG: NAD-dependent epimerase/dehydratase family protein [Filimonas sp.]|nr:NAD-dependent epimerase/dehydratase family protein [Filimonas sp.]